MRTIAFLIVLAELVLFAPLYAAYGQVDPCRALAKEMANRADAAGGLGVALKGAFGSLEIDARRELAEHSSTQCYGRLERDEFRRSRKGDSQRGASQIQDAR